MNNDCRAGEGREKDVCTNSGEETETKIGNNNEKKRLLFVVSFSCDPLPKLLPQA